jgi:hypothetical protein
MVTFEYGTTRFVFCVGGVAIKIARVKILHWVIRLTKRVFVTSSKSVVVVNSQLESAQRFARLKHLFAGVTANLQEIGMCVKYPHLPVAPTLVSFFGFVNIQVRGMPIKEGELAICPFREVADIKSGGITLNQPENFGWVDGRILLLDCGFEGLNVILAKYAKSHRVAA